MTRTLVAITLLASLAVPPAIAQQPDSLPGVRSMRLRRDTLRVSVPPVLVGAGRAAAPRPAPDALARLVQGLRAYGVQESQIEALAEQAVHDSCHRTNPVPVTKKDFIALFQAAL